MLVLLIGTFGIIPSLPLMAGQMSPEVNSNEVPNNIMDMSIPEVNADLAEIDPNYPEDVDLGTLLGDNDNQYTPIFEPWKSKAAIHAIAYDEDTGFLALGGGYLYDNEVHIFRLNIETNEFDKVWDTGDSLLTSDVMSLAFGDTDLNDFMEIVAGCSDGHVYVFEQRHLYDPYANTENQFDLVWKSESFDRVWAVTVADVDRDYRPDIIAGGWDGYVHIFEYDNHSGYPFNEEHWITYREVSTLEVGERVYSIATGDTNVNGLPEIVVGTRAGTVYVFENDGVSIMINGYPFPLINDNNYYLNWTSENYTWTPIRSMEIGELDGDIGEELVIVAQGQGVMTLDWDFNTRSYRYEKVYKQYEAWETFGYWGLDYWADRVISANNVTFDDPDNSSIEVYEPIQYEYTGSGFEPDASVYPYNTAMAMASDSRYSTFDSSISGVDNATAIIDFGQDEEGTGSANDDWDIWVTFKDTLNSGIFSDFNFSVSPDGTDFEQVSYTRFGYSGKILKIDVDDALSYREWDYFQFVKISVFNDAVYEIDSIELMQVYNILSDVLSVEIGPLDLDKSTYLNDGTELDKVLAGTVTGEMIGIFWNTTSNRYDIFWESGDDDSYTFGANMWDIQHIPGVEPEVPNWRLMIGTYMNPDTGLMYNSWSWGFLNFSYIPMHMMGTKNAAIRAYDLYGDLDSGATAQLDMINTHLAGLGTFGWEYTSVETPFLPAEEPMTNNLPMVAVGIYRPEVGLDTLGALTKGNIRFYYRSTTSEVFEEYKEIWELDTTGELTQLVGLAKTTPKMDFADYDGDGDQDMIVSNGHVYLAKNIFVETNEQTGIAWLNFTLVHGYFDDINNLETSRIWGQPEFYDINGDGLKDLILSYADKNGATCFINEGTADNPKWVEDKRIFSNPDPETNMKYLNLTDVRIIPHGYNFYLEKLLSLSGIDLIGDYDMVSYNVQNEALWFSSPVKDFASSYLVATYPRVAQLDLALMKGDNFWNLGYHIHEGWTNDADLDDWTLSISSGDTDNDGNGEIIVGDYDNNVYSFEHLVNNTYKRMFRSFDLNHTEESDVSPYYYEELEGISGDFKRQIWDHAEHLVTDVDLDQDGLKEIIIAAHLQVYIFEDMNLTGGDQLRFAYSFDLRETEWEGRPAWDYVEKITAIDVAEDLDYDGRQELVVAAGPYLFVYNVDPGDFSALEDNDYFVTSLSLEGRYFLVGNPEEVAFRYYQINAMTLCDTDKDGYREIIIGGTNDIRLNRPDGFVYIYECVGGTFQQAWSAPSEVTYWNPISVLTLDDQDYDGEQEIIIGHTKGFDMWEHIPGSDSEYQKVEYVTASPNYPIASYQSTLGDGETYVYSGHYLKDIALFYDEWDDYFWQVYENNGYIYVKAYNQTTDNWFGGGRITGGSINYGPNTFMDSESRPSIFSLDNNDMYIAWEMTATNGSHYICIVWYDKSSSTWSPIVYLPDTTGTFWVRNYYPSVFEFNTTHIGMTYVYDQNLFAIQDRVGCRIRSKDLSGLWTSLTVNYNGYTDFIVHDARTTTLHDGSIAIAMSAMNLALTKPDYDIWVVVVGSDFNFTGVYPHQATRSFYDQYYVDVEYLRSEEHALVVSYENIGAPLEDRFGMTSSLDGGATWGRPDYLHSIPNYIERFEDPLDNTVTYKKGGMFLSGPIAYAPAFSPLTNGGFMYTGTFAYMARISQPFGSDVVTLHYPVGDLCYGINPQSDWVHNDLHDVVDLDVGDTDGDHRREVIVGFDHQVAAYEMKSSSDGNGVMGYDEVWLSNPFENPVTAITVYDSNGNGFEEIGIATARGDVFVYEFSTPSIGVSELMTSEIEWTVPGAQQGSFGSERDMLSVDFDQDGKDEIIFATSNSDFIFCLDDDGTVLWNETPAADSYNNLYLYDVTGDSVPEVFVTCDDTNIYILDITDGSVWDDIISSSYPVFDLMVEDVDQNGEMEILVTTNSGHFWLFHLNGSMYHHYTPTSANLKFMEVGNFTGDSTLMVAISDQNGVLRMLNPLNGTEFYESPSGLVHWECNLQAYDFDNDGIDELAFADDLISIIDFENNEIYYNSSTYSMFARLQVEDYDSDNNAEILGVSQLHGLVMVDAVQRQVQWTYDSQLFGHFAYDFTTGDFGGNGNPDVAVTFWNMTVPYTGDVVVLDGKSGIPIWFNSTDGPALSIVSANITGAYTDSVIAWDTLNLQILAISGYERSIPYEPDKYTIHQLYINQTVTDTYIDAMWIHDLNRDGLDEVITYDDNGFLVCWNATEGTVIWNKTYASGIGDVKFGDVDGGGWDDIILYTYDDIVDFLDGSTGNAYSSVSAEDGFNVVGIAVGEFNSGGSFDDHEVFILTRKTASSYDVYGAWYSEDGLKDYGFSVNFTSSSMSMELTVGHISSTTTLDIIWGSGTSGGRLYRGYDGQYLAVFSTSAYELATGDINADTVDDIAVMDSIGTVRVYNGATYGFMFSKSYGVAVVRGLGFADIHNNDGTEELVVNYVAGGVSAYSSVGAAVWIFSAPITVSMTRSWCDFADMDGDTHIDLVFTNNEYLSVISGSTGELLWHYQHPYRIYRPIVGQFAKVGDAPDVAAFSNTYFYVISGRLTPRNVPLVSPISSSGFGFMQVLGTGLGLGIPLIVVAALGVYRYRRREEE